MKHTSLILKSVFVAVILGVLILMWVHNQQTVLFSLPPLIPSPQTRPIQLVYLAFFLLGLVTGVVLMLGRKRGKG